MKKLTTALLLGAMTLPICAAELTVIDEIEPLVLNGKELTGKDYQSSQVINLQQGQNQLLFALDQLVVEDGRRTKLVFPTVVVKFDATSSPVTLSYPVFRHVDQAKKFRKSLDFSLVDAQGKAVEYQVDLLQVKGFSQFKDYEAVMAEYNQVGGVASVSDNTSVKPHADNSVANKNIQTDVKATAGATSGSIKTDFLSMSPTQRQEFISWAVKHINE
ncbi:YccT family protein [Vibrio sp. VPAP30]|uniref:YccT family protein n=1 Tax=Vibrio sp. VPAP30 TaxID=1647102 RepID=UPI000658F4C3|nr:DUF2057 family protein [Vibrio sp. VPAP30]KLN64332.1 VvgS protein [Vibrio sp. VPAP30]